MSNVSSVSSLSVTTPHSNTDAYSVQITTIRLNGDNYLRLSQSVQMYIRGWGKIGYLTGDKKAPTLEDPTYVTWDAENSMVMTWLVNSMDEDINSKYMCYSTAKELWDNGEDSITKYFNSLKHLWQDLDLFNDYEWKSTKDANHYRQTMEAHRIYKFLAGLNVEFDEVRGRIISRTPLPPIGEVFAEVWREESRKHVMLGKKTAYGPVESSALVVAEAAANKAANFQRKSEEKPRVW
ncbi:hypothetical protein MRB53_017196 [Persea americana]|uniref:Uncharacterized protein n=1 Tax=Persea americana TaxID=3435 RepID=A0ACC2M5Q2_PERAE|nr:hypothetical protein MRB53_017196 [Persea americana]